MNTPPSTLGLLLAHYINAANTANQQAQYAEAYAFAKRALAIDDRSPEAWYNLALAEKGLGRLNAALQALQRTELLAPKSADALNSIGLQYLELGALDPADTLLNQALKQAPGHALALSNQGKLRMMQGRAKEAVSLFETAIAQHPRLAALHINLCSALIECGSYHEAEYAGRAAVDLAGDDPHAWTNLGAALDMLGRPQEAIKCHDKAITLAPEFSDAWFNKGNALTMLGQVEQSYACYRQAVQIDPAHAEAQLNLARLLFSAQRFPECWNKLEDRWQLRDERPPKLATAKPDWLGKASAAPLLLWGEQGIGDQILYASILPELAELPQKKYVALDKRLIPLFARSMPGFEFVDLATVSDALGFAEQLPLGSLPRFFRPDLTSFSNARHPYLQADADRSAELRHKIVRKDRLVCGVSWASKRQKLGPYKSLSLEQMLLPLASSRWHFVDLQYGDTAAERQALQEAHGIEVQHLDEVDNFHDIDGLAALIQACDVVITTSNSTAHLAGALGKPTLLLLPSGKGQLWYWAEINGTIPWYPSIQPFRQKETGNWQHPLQAIKAVLETR